MAASFVVPVNLISPSPVKALDTILQWDIVDTPGSYWSRNDIVSPSEINKLVAGPADTGYQGLAV